MRLVTFSIPGKNKLLFRNCYFLNTLHSYYKCYYIKFYYFDGLYVNLEIILGLFTVIEDVS